LIGKKGFTPFDRAGYSVLFGFRLPVTISLLVDLNWGGFRKFYLFTIICS
jgi:hypothetical protein